jgi:cytoskeletal protein RodZ
MEDAQHTHKLAPDAGDNGGANGGAKIGRILEHRRKERGLSLDDVEQATKIRKRYLEGLERDDYDVLPAGVYAQGFLKTYANYLGLDGEELTRQLKSRRKRRRERGINYDPDPEDGFEEPLISPAGLQGTGQRRFPTSAVVTLLVAVLVLAAVIGALYFVGRGVETSRPERNEPPPAENQPKQNPEKAASRQESKGSGTQENAAGGEGGAAAEQDADAGQKAGGAGTDGAPQRAPADTLRVSIRVSERPSWLLIRADGTVIYAQVVEPGFYSTFRADRRLYIQGGDGGAVQVEINGQDAGTLGEPYNIGEKNFTLKNAS